MAPPTAKGNKIMKTAEFERELTQHIIPFWNALRDNENGGFTGYMDNSLNINKKGEKGVILHSRILWFYSSAYMLLKDPALLENAEHAYRFLTEKCLDKKFGGVYWSMNYDGSVKEDFKHTYCQAFFIYALSAYRKASGNKTALKYAYETMDLIERKCTDDLGYLETKSRDWKKELPNDELSENGLMAEKTMNTVLHLLEAYTELYSADHNESVLDRLLFQLELFSGRIFDGSGNKLRVFFDKNMEEIGDVHSYGHDIEATWLIDRACEVIGSDELKKRFGEINSKIVRNVANIAYDKNSGSLLNESDKGVVNTWRIWWVQAESVIGFTNAFQKGYGGREYLDIASNIWNYIENKIIDKRAGGEWFSQVDEDGSPAEFKPVVDPWKCPYHNGRMCIEMIGRLKKI